MIYTGVQFVRNVKGSKNCTDTTVCAIAVSKENALTATFPDLKDADLAQATAQIGKPDTTGQWVIFAEHPLSTPPPGDAAKDLQFPGEHTTYYHSSGDVEWWAAQVGPDQEVLQAQGWRTYANGKQYDEKWSHGAYGPSVTTTRHERRGNLITANLALFSDSTWGHYGVAGDLGVEGRTELRRNGKLVDGTTSADGGTFQVPPDKARYRLEATTKTVQAAWEFESRESTGPLPLTAVRFDDRDGGTIPFRLDKTTTAGRTKKLTVDVSYDDGKTWQPASYALFGDRGVLLSVKPGPISLKTRVTDVNGNSGEQTLIRALT
jgi:hypothetical protein